MYLKVSPVKGYDERFYKLGNDQTWAEILNIVEKELDDQYLDQDHDNSILGIKLTIEVVDQMPEDVEID